MSTVYTTSVYKRRYALRQAFCDWQIKKGEAIRCFTLDQQGRINTNLNGRFTIFGGDCPKNPVQYKQEVELENGTVIKLY